MSFPDIMVDIETTGLDFDKNHILQIAAVRFNLKERTVDHNFFDRALMPAPGRFWDEDTRTWWLKDKREILNGIMKKMEPVRMVLEDLQRFTPPDAVFWAKPTHFDHSFLSSYFRQYELGNPFAFYKAKDLRSFTEGLAFPATGKDWVKELPFEGPMHNALFDTLHQISALFAATAPPAPVVERVESPDETFDTMDKDVRF